MLWNHRGRRAKRGSDDTYRDAGTVSNSDGFVGEGRVEGGGSRKGIKRAKRDVLMERACWKGGGWSDATVGGVTLSNEPRLV